MPIDTATPTLALPRTFVRWIVYGVVLALALISIRATQQPEGPASVAPARAPQDPYRTADAATSGAARVLELDLERLALRAQRNLDVNLFSAGSWEAPQAQEARNAPPPPPALRAPPLPFAFLGQLVEEGRVTVFLTNGARNWIVRTGDTIDGAYRVEAIGDRTMILTYLPLETQQELAIGGAPPHLSSGGASVSEGLPVAVSPPGGALLPGEVALLLAAPSRVAAGNALIVNIGLRPSGDVRNARVELAYDPKVFAAVGAPVGDSGRLTVDLAGATGSPKQVRFRVIAQSPTNTQIGIEKAIATDALGASVAIATPSAHRVAVVQPHGAN